MARASVKLLSAVLPVCFVGFVAPPKVARQAGERVVPAGYRLVWSDEFERAGRPDQWKWGYEIGFVRNRELQWYQPDNARCEKGLLIIEARRERKLNPWFVRGTKDWRAARRHADYTSTSLTTRGLHAWKYGRFEMRARIDVRPGLWPAFWMLGSNQAEVGWPACGEIDIMEYFKGILLANAAWTRNGKGIQWDDSKKLLSSFEDPKWASRFHVWIMDWDEERIQLWVDDVLLNTVRIADTFDDEQNHRTPFRKPMFIILNLAIGGTAGGDPSETSFPARFEVDYVRVYQRE